jgi:hypothetical protein
MHLHFLSLSLIFMLCACQGNSSDESLGLSPISKDPDTSISEPEPTDTEPAEPTDPEPTDPEPTDPEPTDPSTPTPEEPIACISSHSDVQPATANNSRTDFVFFSSLANNNLQAYELLTNSRLDVIGTGFSTATAPFQFITGSNLASKSGVNNGEWLLESSRLLFSDTVTGEIKQISSLDTNGSKICSIRQIKPTLERLSEIYINYGLNCSLNAKVNLAMASTDPAITIPSSAVAEGAPLYDNDANWLGQLHKVVEQGKAKLVFLKPDICSQNVLFEFTENANTWSAEQYSDGSLLLRIEEKVFYLSLADVLLLIADDSNYSFPAPLITLSSANQDLWLGKSSSEIYVTNLVINQEMPENNKAELLVYGLAGDLLSGPISLYSGTDTAKTIVGFDKVVLDDDSLWLESRFTTIVSDAEHYHRRYSRWDISSKNLDSVAQFDYELTVKDQVSEWYSIANKVYLKVNERTGLYQAVDVVGEKDYLLQAGSAASIEQKVWHFIKQDSNTQQLADSVIAWDYSNHAIDQYTARLSKADGSSAPFSTLTRDIRALIMISQYGDLSLFGDMSCTSGCVDGDPNSQYEYRVSALKLSNGSVSELHHETCNTVNTEPQSQTCVVN